MKDISDSPITVGMEFVGEDNELLTVERLTADTVLLRGEPVVYPDGTTDAGTLYWTDRADLEARYAAMETIPHPKATVR